MTQRIGDRAKETALAPGTGDISLAGPVTGFTAFSAITGMGTGDTTYYTISDGGANWEVGLGTYVSSGNKLQRTTILRSSNSNAAVNFTNPITVWCDAPAVKLPLYNSAGDLALAAAAAMLIGGAPSGNSLLAVLTAQAVVGYFNSTAANGAYSLWLNNGTQNGGVGSAKGLFNGSLADFGIRAESNLIFGIGATQVGKIDAAGNLLVGTTTSAGSLSNGRGVLAGLFSTFIDTPNIRGDGVPVTLTYSGLAPLGIYDVSCGAGGTGGVANCSGQVLCGDPNVIAETALINSVYYTVGVFQVALQNTGGAAGFSFDPANALSFQFVVINSSGVDQPARVSIHRRS